jgi:uridine kinase
VHALVRRLAAAVDELLERQPRVLVGIDGPDAAGKTMLADQLAAALQSNAVRASIDGFHNPISVRQRRGRFSPEGY